jgi:hypothetical protein
MAHAASFVVGDPVLFNQFKGCTVAGLKPTGSVNVNVPGFGVVSVSPGDQANLRLDTESLPAERIAALRRAAGGSGGGSGSVAAEHRARQRASRAARFALAALAVCAAFFVHRMRAPRAAAPLAGADSADGAPHARPAAGLRSLPGA